jgi:hypothetical protein
MNDQGEDVMRFATLAFLVAMALAGASPAAAVSVFDATLSGANVVPPNASPATGVAHITLSDDLSTLDVEVTFSGLIGQAVGAHIHCCVPPGVNTVIRLDFTGAGFPLGVTSGTYSHAFTLASSVIGLTPSAFIAALEAGQAYVDIHSTVLPGGEIRGQLAVPEPMSLYCLGAGVALLGLRAWRHRRP